MKSLAAGTASGCVVWLIVFVALTICLLPVAAAAASITATVSGEWVAGILEPYLCPPDSTAEITTYQTTTMDSDGFTRESTAYEMQCVNAAGQVVQAPSPVYGFVWVGVLLLAALIASALLALLLAAPAAGIIGSLTSRFSNRRGPAAPR